MQVANTFFFKTKLTKKASKPLRARPDRGSGPIRKPIGANMLHNLLYVPAISPNQSDHDANPNVPDIAIVSETEIWAICKVKSTNVFLFEWDGRTDKNDK